MRRYRLGLTKFVYPPLFLICLVSGYQFYGMIVKEFSDYLFFLLLVRFAFLSFLIFLLISFVILVRKPRMKRYEQSLKTVLEFESLDEDVLISQGSDMRKETAYRLSAKRVYCPSCHTPTEGVAGSRLVCHNCGESFSL